ncbi:hypothetical protein ETB97_012189 [Aspergillus alliaceus]|uniref:Uncharacterized protein n=1 Tax=Petromyces alliaceus TaxID=209559 RepID=A0A8H6A3G9_PETAA|nr:hypothetical protein ETB97_012189 [Aspergillus burnettii]
MLDHIIFQNGGSTVNIDRLPGSLQKTKTEQPPTVEDLYREIGRLREEVAFYQETHHAMMGLFEETREAYRLLRDALQAASLHQDLPHAFMSVTYSARKAGTAMQKALREASDKVAVCEKQFLRSFGISLDDTSTRDWTIL